MIFVCFEGILLFNFRSNFNAIQTLILRFGDLCSNYAFASEKKIRYHFEFKNVISNFYF